MFFFFNDTATTEIYTLSLHDALPISLVDQRAQRFLLLLGEEGARGFPHLVPCLLEARQGRLEQTRDQMWKSTRSEEHTSELQSLRHLVCRLLLEKKNNTAPRHTRPRA